MTRLYALLFLLEVGACAADMQPVIGQPRPAKIDFAKLAVIPIDEVVGIYHLIDRVDAINLELRDDHSFRWSLQGCDTFGGDNGRFKLKTPTTLVLTPEAGRASFLWSALRTDQVSEITMELDSDRLFEPIRIGGVAEQIWAPGGVCAICGGGFGPTGQEACEDPNFEE